LFEEDAKHLLYRQYLRIVRRFKPIAFLMENVPGLLSAKHKGTKIFESICSDLRATGYALNALNPTEPSADVYNPNRFVVAADQFGVPQTRARVFILGLRDDLGLSPMTLKRPSDPVVTVKDVLNDLPRIRSRLSKEVDCGHNWQAAIRELERYQFVGLENRFYDSLRSRLETVHPNYPLGQQAMRRVEDGPSKLSDWFVDRECGYILNHNSRAHMRSDLRRYFFWSQYASFYGRSPKLSGVPFFLRPAHENVKGNATDLPFADRFRVQLPGSPATTIVSHIAKDGHYYIHFEPRQCRSLSVREAARLQTFPDNYFFEGAVTEQYHQVGNAVPPYLAMQIATVVESILCGKQVVRQRSSESSRELAAGSMSAAS
jgi:DNA (cytosine-5)-methyltransferase 1